MALSEFDRTIIVSNLAVDKNTVMRAAYSARRSKKKNRRAGETRDLVMRRAITSATGAKPNKQLCHCPKRLLAPRRSRGRPDRHSLAAASGPPNSGRTQLRS